MTDSPAPTPLRDALVLAGQSMAQADCRPFLAGQACWFSAVSPTKTRNEDCAALFPLGPERGVLAVADGVGGMPEGGGASRTALLALQHQLERSREGGASVAGALLEGFEEAGREVARRHPGSATTLAVVELDGASARTFHTGDSEILVIDAGGELLWRTLPHSPVGYAVEAGVLHPHDAMFHDARHLVSNVVGTLPTSVEVSTRVPLPPGATVLLASDGLLDNLHAEEIVTHLSGGDLPASVSQLVRAAQRRMAQEDPGPSKPDDLTVMAWRCGGPPAEA